MPLLKGSVFSCFKALFTRKTRSFFILLTGMFHVVRPVFNRKKHISGVVVTVLRLLV